MFGIDMRDNFDGAPIHYTEDELKNPNDKHELVNVEFWNGAIGDVPVGMKPGLYGNNTYKALRLVSDNHSFLYTVWCNGEKEFYGKQTSLHRLCIVPTDPYRRHENRQASDVQQTRRATEGHCIKVFQPKRVGSLPPLRRPLNGHQELQAGLLPGSVVSHLSIW